MQCNIRNASFLLLCRAGSEVPSKAAGFCVLLLTMWHGPLIMAVSNILIGLINQVVNARPNIRLLGYSFKEQILDILPSAALSAFMFLTVWGLHFLIKNSFILLSVQVLTGVTVYIGGSVVFHNESFFYIWNTIREIRLSRSLK